MRVLQVLDKLDRNSGVCSVVLNYWRNLDRKKTTWDFMVNEEPSVEFRQIIEDSGSQIYVMPSLKGKNILNYIRLLYKFFHNNNSYQIVHGHIPNAALFYLGIAKIKGIPIRILHSHNAMASDKFFRRLRNRILFLAIPFVANQYAACSQKAGQFLFGHRTNKAKEIKLFPNAIEVELFRFNLSIRDTMRKTLQLENCFVVGHVGRFSEQKNHKFLLNIFQKILDKKPNAKLILIGDGECRPQAEVLAHKLNLDQHVRFCGQQQNISSYYQVMDAFLLPSLFEGLPVVGVEAQASGLPCFFSDTITQEAVVGGDVHFIPLTYPPQKWADIVLSKAISTNRSNGADLVCQSGYDIRKQAFCMTDYHISLTKDVLS